MKKLFIIFAILCLAAPAMAADWNFYGSSRMATWYISDDYDVDSTAQYEDDDDVQWDNGGNSRFGANVKTNDQIGGGLEIGFDRNDVYTRKLFGTYTFSGGSQLLIGQTYTPTALFYSNSVFGGDGDLLGLGEFYDNRWPMIQWKVGGFKIAAITPRGTGVNTPEIDYILPKIEVSYGFKGDMFFVDVIGGYQTFDLDSGNAPGQSEDSVDAYIGILGGGVNFGALYVKASVHAGQNLGNFGSSGPYVTPPGSTLDTGAILGATDIYDTAAFGALGVVGFNVSEMLSFEGGVGFQEYDKDDQPGVVSEKEKLIQFYLQSTINIAPGFFIVPEVGYVEADPDNAGATSDPNPKRFYIGAKWQINF